MSEDLEALVEYCRTAGRKSFPDWTAADVRQWLAWHAERNALLTLRNEAGQYVALGAGRLWGHTFIFERVIATRPGALRQLVSLFKQRYPQWATWELWQHCGADRLRRVDERWLNRLETSA